MTIPSLEAVDCGSRELDARIYALMYDRTVREADAPKGSPWEGRRLLLAKNRKPPHDECVLGVWWDIFAAVQPNLPYYTTSVDSALALSAEKLPGWFKSVTEFEDGRWEAEVHNELTERYAVCATPALALCAALLKALGDTNGER